MITVIVTQASIGASLKLTNHIIWQCTSLIRPREAKQLGKAKSSLILQSFLAHFTLQGNILSGNTDAVELSAADPSCICSFKLDHDALCVRWCELSLYRQR